MYNSKLVHEYVMREYEKMNIQRQRQAQKKREAIYEKLPEVKEIDDKISSLAVKHASRIIKDKISPKEAVAAVEAEKEILLEKRRQLLDAAGENMPVEPEYFCPICRDTGFVGEKKCSCYDAVLKKVMSSALKGSLGLSINLSEDIFDNFSLKWYDKKENSKLGVSAYENMKAVLTECKLFCVNFNKSGGNLYFYGDPGTGKTFMASCIASELIKQGKSVMYQSAYKLFQFMEDYKFGKISREETEEEYNAVYSSDLLIIDDLGTEFSTTYTCSVLFDILNTRLINEKSTIISTNLSVNNLSEKYTDRVSSRIIGNFELMRFMGNDIRIAKKFDRR